jgi:hypothetical protein
MARFAWIVSLTFAAAMAPLATASAQGPTAEQRDALRAHCVSDYRANCASVPTGGMAALVCLEQHIDRLSPSCQAAVPAAQGATEATAHPPAAAPASTPAAAARPALARDPTRANSIAGTTLKKANPQQQLNGGSRPVSDPARQLGLGRQPALGREFVDHAG